MYDFLVQHGAPPPKSVLFVGDGDDAVALWAACHLTDAHRVVALVDADTEATDGLKKISHHAGLSSLRVTRGALSTTALRKANNTGEAPRVRLRAVEVLHRTRFDWVVLDARTAQRFVGLTGGLDDGGARVVVARFTPDDASAARRFRAALPPPWVGVNAHPSHVACMRATSIGNSNA
jgi:hypothetical protein